jgi:hypothetical protein
MVKPFFLAEIFLGVGGGPTPFWNISVFTPHPPLKGGYIYIYLYSVYMYINIYHIYIYINIYISYTYNYVLSIYM